MLKKKKKKNYNVNLPVLCPGNRKVPPSLQEGLLLRSGKERGFSAEYSATPFS